MINFYPVPMQMCDLNDNLRLSDGNFYDGKWRVFLLSDEGWGFGGKLLQK